MKEHISSHVLLLAVISLLWLLVCSCSGKGADPGAAKADPAVAQETPIPVKIVRHGDGFQLMRGGEPYFIKGAGGDGSKTELKAIGANSWRTWGADNLDGQLAQAQKLGMTITIGIWLGHKDQGFNWDDPAAVAAQYAAAKQDILAYRNSPALIVWAIGNEMENGDEDDVAMWNGIEAIAKMAHQLDPNHPTMTVFAEVGGDKIAMVNKYCPDIDIIGINSYGGGASVGARYVAAGGVKPYIITEYGPAGIWESGKNAWGVVPELTSTQKAADYRATYEGSIANNPLCLGSYAFTWGYKQEATATWFGLLLPDGRKLGAVDTLEELWTGHKPKYLCPDINSLTLAGPAQVAPGATVTASLDASDPQGLPLTAKWVLTADPTVYSTGGATESTPPSYPDAIISSSLTSATVKMPPYGRTYRLYAYVYNNHNGAAVGNISLDVQGGADPPPPSAATASLPFVIYGPNAATNNYIPSGYMGNTGAIAMDSQCTTDPHEGTSCIKATYNAASNWGGVVWQNPANDWGATPGGLNLTGAKKLTFWARGDKGGEVVSFLFGLIGRDQPNYDSAKGELSNVTLTPDWKQYSIDLTGKNMSDIITGFAWTAASTGQPVTFYLDDIQYQ